MLKNSFSRLFNWAKALAAIFLMLQFVRSNITCWKRVKKTTVIIWTLDWDISFGGWNFSRSSLNLSNLDLSLVGRCLNFFPPLELQTLNCAVDFKYLNLNLNKCLDIWSFFMWLTQIWLITTLLRVNSKISPIKPVSLHHDL